MPLPYAGHRPRFSPLRFAMEPFRLASVSPSCGAPRRNHQCPWTTRGAPARKPIHRLMSSRNFVLEGYLINRSVVLAPTSEPSPRHIWTPLACKGQREWEKGCGHISGFDGSAANSKSPSPDGNPRVWFSCSFRRLRRALTRSRVSRRRSDRFAITRTVTQATIDGV